jgi:hypothetical protein
LKELSHAITCFATQKRCENDIQLNKKAPSGAIFCLNLVFDELAMLRG